MIPLILLLACASPPPALTAFAASSLTDALPAVVGAWQAAGGGPVTLSFDASSRLARQIDAGAPADLFFSADAAWMAYLAERGRIDPSSQRELLGNSLVVVVPADANFRPDSLAALADPRLARVALAGASVPVGRYAREALGAAGVLDAIAPRVIDGEDARAVLAWVARGEVDAGLVYATDAKAEPKVAVAHWVDERLHTPIRYPAAAVAQAPDAADRFLQFCTEDAAKAIFLDAGFAVLP